MNALPLRIGSPKGPRFYGHPWLSCWIPSLWQVVRSHSVAAVHLRATGDNLSLAERWYDEVQGRFDARARYVRSWADRMVVA